MKLGAQALAKARGHDETTLVVKGMLGPTGKARNFASQGKTSTSLHQLPLATTIRVLSVSMQQTTVTNFRASNTRS
jgi:hypothetical protein